MAGSMDWTPSGCTMKYHMLWWNPHIIADSAEWSRRNAVIIWLQDANSLDWLSNNAYEMSWHAKPRCPKYGLRCKFEEWLWTIESLDAAMLAIMSFLISLQQSDPESCIKRSLQWLQQGEKANMRRAHDVNYTVIIPKDASTLVLKRNERWIPVCHGRQIKINRSHNASG